MSASATPARIALVVGIRPNLVKIAPIYRALEHDRRLEPLLVHTGQHWEANMSDVFLEQLGLPEPAVKLAVGSGTHGEQTGAAMAALENCFKTLHPAIVVTVGDGNSTLAAALVAAKACIPQAHVEAGLRSGDPTMPEEVNRVVTDRLADLLFTHSAEANEHLYLEGIAAERVYLVGNVMIDSLLQMRTKWQGAAAATLRDLPRDYGVVTLHRPATVDDDATLALIVKALEELAAELPLIFPVHPRTRRHLPSVLGQGLHVVEPLGYLAFLDLVEHARLVITDSGGVQEETTVLGVPCLTFRDNTERRVTIRLGTNRLIGTEPARIRAEARAVLAAPRPTPVFPPFWDGHAAERIAAKLADWIASPGPLRLQA